MVNFLKSILLFFDLHTSLLEFLSANCVEILKASKGSKINVNHHLPNLEFIYVYDGAISFSMEDRYSLQ